MKVGIVSNSPGELVGWAIPASQILKNQGFLVDLYLTPCMFATKNEFKVALKHGNFNQIFQYSETFKEMILKKNFYDIFFHMGGEIWYSTKFKTQKLLSYAWGTQKLDKFFHSYLVPNQYYHRKLISRNIPENKIFKIKDLVFEKFRKMNFSAGGNYNHNSKMIGFMLGSRIMEFWGLLEIYLKTILILEKNLKNERYKYVFFISPFIYQNYENFETFKSKIENFANSFNLGDVIKKIEFLTDEEEKVLKLSKLRLLITIPGTKTNEAGYLGIPQLVILPLQKPEYIPVWGILGWLDFLGTLGKKMKGYFIWQYAKKNIFTRKRYIAMPNIISNKEVVPEYAGIITPETLANLIFNLVSDINKLQSISNSLKEIYEEWENQAISFKHYLQKILSLNV